MSNNNLVLIDNVNIASVYGFYLTQRELSAPAVKEEYIDVPGAHGSYDATEAMGAVFYADRNLSLGFKYADDDFDDDLSGLTNYLHGKRRKIVFQQDPLWYYVGRISVGNYSSSDHRLGVSAVVYPYKLAVEETVVTAAVSGSETLTLVNDEMPVIPVVTVDAEMTLAWGDKSKTISAGTYRIAGFELQSGETELVVTGTGNISITYRKGRL